MSMMDLPRQIVDVFYRRREKSEEYIVRLDIEPNPLDYDGCDAVYAAVIRRDRRWEFGMSREAAVVSEQAVLKSKVFTSSVVTALLHLAEQASELETDPNHRAALLEHVRSLEASA